MPVVQIRGETARVCLVPGLRAAFVHEGSVPDDVAVETIHSSHGGVGETQVLVPTAVTWVRPVRSSFAGECPRTILFDLVVDAVDGSYHLAFWTVEI